MVALSRTRIPSDSTSTVLFALVCLMAGGVIAVSLAIPQGPSSEEPAFSSRAFDFPPFHLRVEDHVEGQYKMAFELDWLSRNDWTERYVRNDGTVGLETKKVLGQEVTVYGMGPAHTYAVGEDAVHVPGIWFRDVVATLPGPREERSRNGSVVTVRRTTPADIEEWDADATTGIPLGYRQIVDGGVVREYRVVSLVLADGTVVR